MDRDFIEFVNQRLGWECELALGLSQQDEKIGVEGSLMACRILTIYGEIMQLCNEMKATSDSLQRFKRGQILKPQEREQAAAA